MNERRRAETDLQKDEIIERLRSLWKAYPQLRFMQLLGNVYHRDAYNVEDYDMISTLESVYRALYHHPPEET